MFAGIVSLEQNRKIYETTITEIQKYFDSNSGLNIVKKRMNNSFFVRGYTSALSEYSGVLHDEEDNLSFIAGEPLLSDDEIEEDHRTLMLALKDRRYADLSSVRGVFCAARYEDAQEPVLELCADKLGVRPIYYWSDGHFVVFATALKILESVTMIPKEVDLSALSETFAFGIPLADRTRYKHIKVMREAEIVRFKFNSTDHITYFRWDQIRQRNVPMTEAIKNTYEIFKDSIRIRLKNDSSALAFLSGGMDSRAIVAVLKDMDIDVHTFNCSPEVSQDKVFAKQYADTVKCPFHSMPFPEKSLSHMAKTVLEISENKKLKTTRPKALWSGDGGSVGLGCVYLDEKVVEEFRHSDQLEAIQHFKKKNSYALPLGVMKKEKKNELSKFLDKAISEELGRIKSDDKGQQIFLFLMLNDQRRHMYNIYENIDFHGTEYQLPFFDFKFLEYILSLPLDYRLNHKLYDELYKLLPSSVTSVPWQTYPGHVPCPLHIDNDLKYQWEKSHISFIGKLKKQMPEGIEGFKIGIFAKNINPLCRYKYSLTVLAHFLCLKNFDYIIKAGRIYSSKV